MPDVVASAGTGLDAVEVARRTKPVAVLMDLRIPTMSGIEACALLRKHLPHTPVVLLSA